MSRALAKLGSAGLLVCVAWACASFEARDAAATDAGASEASSEAASDAASGDASASAYRAAVLADGPLVYWRMGRTESVLVPDETGGGNDLVLQNAGHYTTGVPGAIADDTAIAFDGFKGFALATNPRALDFSGGAPFTVECWARREIVDGGSYYQHMISHTQGRWEDGSENGYILFLLPTPQGKDLARTYGEYGSRDAGAMDLLGDLVAPSRWAHYVEVFDGSALSLYVDGTIQASRAVPAPFAASTAPFALAKHSDDDAQYFPGALDEVAVYAKALDLGRIAAHRALGPP